MPRFSPSMTSSTTPSASSCELTVAARAQLVQEPLQELLCQPDLFFDRCCPHLAEVSAFLLGCGTGADDDARRRRRPADVAPAGWELLPSEPDGSGFVPSLPPFPRWSHGRRDAMRSGRLRTLVRVRDRPSPPVSSLAF